ncbi:hypothetical protein [Pseudomonas syringae]|uniref:hypothetical protein n=1 Tax=Pseudomonas syringae TaxID=317 RepID=UPI000FFF1200|nr:hypothetical protein [Pseudomonas syringae]MCK9776164.1 hypothetical protein [Pseudomonas syringae pv. syringae]RXF65652.1 hypothetical protein BKM77_05220 [Pseudomonas syringae]
MKAIIILPGIICTLLASNAIAGSGNESGGFQVMTSIATILGAILVFIVSQIVLKLVIEPVQQLKGSIGQTANTLLRYQAKITNAATDEEVSATVKGHAADLMSKAEVISCYRLAQKIFGLPTKADIRSAAQELNLIGYSLMSAFTQYQQPHEMPADIFKLSSSNSKALAKIGTLLKVSTSY